MNKDKRSLHDRGTIDSKGHWKPPYSCQDSPLFRKPFNIKILLKYLFVRGFIFPKLVLYTLLSIATFYLLKNDLTTSSSITLQFAGMMFLRNLVMVIAIYGGYHMILYRLKLQGKKQKYNPEWQARNNKRYLFKDQTLDNMFRTCTHGVLIWTLYELLYVWAIQQGFIPLISWAGNPVYFVLLFLLLPIYREAHFFFVHLLLHKGWFMKNVHSVHHKNINPGPWSGLSMHWIEHLLYFSSLLIHFIVPSHPIHFFLTSLTAGLTPAAGHIGYEGPIYNEKYTSGDYFHYLHHKHVSCNFGTGNLPLDRWFGYLYDGEGKYENMLLAKKKRKAM